MLGSYLKLNGAHRVRSTFYTDPPSLLVVPSQIMIPDMHATIKHDSLASHSDHHTAATNILPGTQGKELDLGLLRSHLDLEGKNTVSI